MPTIHEKAERFRDLHKRPGAFVIPNPWDAGTAKILQHLGFEALATTSSGYAFSQGLPDHGVGRDDMMRHVATIVQATDLPVSADLGNGFGDQPKDISTTIRLAGDTGLCGASIEDSTTDPAQPLYDFNQSVDRVAAAVSMARSMSVDFVVTARAENFLVGQPDIEDVILRLRAYQAAGADVLYAPGLSREADIRAVTEAVDRPVNVVMGAAGSGFSVKDLENFGVKRISVGSALSRAALGAFMRAAREMKENGTFAFADDAAPFKEINSIF